MYGLIVAFNARITVSAIYLALRLLFTVCILRIALFSWFNKFNAAAAAADDDDDDIHSINS